MTLDIAMGGSTNTVLHLLAAAHEAGSTSRWPTSTACRGACRASPRSRPRRRVPHGGHASRRRGHGAPRRARPRRPDPPRSAHDPRPDDGQCDRPRGCPAGRGFRPRRLLPGVAGWHSDPGRVLAGATLRDARSRPRARLHPLDRARVLEGRRPGGAVRQHRARTAASSRRPAWTSRSSCPGPAGVWRDRRRRSRGSSPGSSSRAMSWSSDTRVRGRPGHAGDAVPSELPEGDGARQDLRPPDGRAILRWHVLARRSATPRRRRPRAA